MDNSGTRRQYARRLFWIIPAVLVSVSLLWYLSGDPPTTEAPTITFPLIDGREIALDSLVGRPVLINFWASTCIECRKEIPHLVDLYHEFSDYGLEIIGVAMPYDPPNRILESSNRMDVPYPVALDIEGEAVQAFGNVAGTPTSFLVSPQGRIVMRHSGTMDMDKLKADIISQLPEQSQVTSHKL